MEKLRRAFLSDSIARLEKFQKLIQNGEFSAETVREILRFLHTVKGTSQTFGLIAAAKTSHETESILQALRDGKAEQNQDLNAFLNKGLNLLREILEGKTQMPPETFFAEIKTRFPQIVESEKSFVNLSKYISDDQINGLSGSEKHSLIYAIENGKNFFIIETDFEPTDFSDELPKLLAELDKTGDVIATFPIANRTGKMGFRHFFVTEINQKNLTGKIKIFGSQVFEPSETNYTNDLHGILANTVAVAEQTAKLLDKKISIEIVNKTDEISFNHPEHLADILLHLTRNAIDHGINCEGKIKIEISFDGYQTVLKFSDDGRGIDKEKLRAAAIEKNLPAEAANLSEEEFFDLIFAHGLSTSKNISEISGRGIGLDTVKDLVEKSGGTISVKSSENKGTTFEIVLKNNDVKGAHQ